MMSTLELKGRYYRMVPQDRSGYHEHTVRLDPAKTSFVAMHCWDIGFPHNPTDKNYSVGLGYEKGVHEAARIIKEVIVPAVDACRLSSVMVSHVESDFILDKHRPKKPDLNHEKPKASRPGPVVPGWSQSITYGRAHGHDYVHNGPYSRMDRVKELMPKDDEPFVATGEQWDAILRKKGIENLIYTGFATDMCILRSPGGAQDMFSRGYRIYIIREGTLGIEFEDSFDQRLATWWGLRYFESKYGDSFGINDFMQALESIRK